MKLRAKTTADRDAFIARIVDDAEKAGVKLTTLPRGDLEVVLEGDDEQIAQLLRGVQS